MMLELFMPALLAGFGVSLATGPVGCFVVWRRMAYFGDTLAHGALMGVALSLLLQLPTTLGIMAICTVTALSLILLQKRFLFSTDTLLGILSHTVLALGMITISLTNTQVNLLNFLFGDILSVLPGDLYWIFGVAAITHIVLRWQWSGLINTTLNEALAQVEGIKTDRLNILLMILMATVTTIGIKVVGVLLTTALFIIPPAAARQFSESPEQMVCYSTLIAMISTFFGLLGSMMLDAPVGPMIVISATTLFLLSHLPKIFR